MCGSDFKITLPIYGKYCVHVIFLGIKYKEEEVVRRRRMKYNLNLLTPKEVVTMSERKVLMNYQILQTWNK